MTGSFSHFYCCPNSFMQVVENHFGNYLHRAYGERYRKVTSNKIGNHHRIYSTNNPPANGF